MRRLARRGSLVLVLVCAASLLEASGALAVGGAGPEAPAKSRSNTDLVINRLGSGQGVSGFLPNAANPFDPVTDGYPASNPSTASGSGWRRVDEGFAGIIHTRPPGGGPELSLYCIDISTGTNVGYGYALGTWDAGNVPNVGYVARLLNKYYPNTGEPSALTDLDQRSAAVQAAIWFFTDRYVLSTADPVRGAVAAIVADVLADGPVPEPEPPSVAIDPPSRSGSGVLGPFAITTDRPPARVSATGADMFADAAATEPIPNGEAVASGRRIWLRSSAPGTAVLEASARATVPGGNVFLYDGNTSGVEDAQKLILAETGVLDTTVRASAEFRSSGALRVTKTIAGPAAGAQDRVVIHVACDDGVDRPDLVIAPGATGTASRTYEDITDGTRCTVTETADGTAGASALDVVVAGGERTVTIAGGHTTTVGVTDTYTSVDVPVPAPGTGTLLVTKSLTGPLAGRQGAVTLRVTCAPAGAPQDVAIPAGTPAGSVTRPVSVPAGAACTVAEVADGGGGAVVATVSGSGQTVAVPGGTIVPVTISDRYDAPAETAGAGVVSSPTGALRVSKTLAGPAAGRQGAITIRVSCGGPLHAYVFRIPAHARAGTISRAFPELSPGDRCTVIESAHGATRTVRAITDRRRRTVTIPAAGEATVAFRDRFLPRRTAPAVTG